MPGHQTSRRAFLKRAVLRTGGAWAGLQISLGSDRNLGAASAGDPSQVAVVQGSDRADNIYRALQTFRKEIVAAIGKRRIIVKPNVVSVSSTKGLAVTHVDCLEGVLAFLESIGKANVVIAESSAEGQTLEGYHNYGYFNLARQYPVRLVDLNQEGHETFTIWRGSGTQTVRIARMLLDTSNFVISVPRMKTHDCVVTTLALKNIVMSAPIVDVARWHSQPPGSRADKSRMHGLSNQDLNDNLHRLAPYLAPDLAVIDGFEGMEGNGPTRGTAVSHGVAVASLDWLAAERVAVELMGVDPSWPAYLTYCGQTGLGEYDLARIEVLGEPIADHVLTYRLHDNVANQLGMRPTPRT